MAEAPPDDPDARLWAHALRAQIDAVVLHFEVQLRQHVATTVGIHAREAAGLREHAAMLEGRLTEARARYESVASEAQRTTVEATERGHEVQRLRTELAAREGEVDRLESALAAMTAAREASLATVATLEAQLREIGQQVQTLDEQFTAEKRWVAALLTVMGSGLFDAAQQALGVTVEATPGCYGALKARKADVVLTLAVRERGRGVTRTPMTDAEGSALRAMAEASGCELVEPAVGARFTPATMDKAGTRPEPSEEDMVLECVMPGLRLAGSPGSLVHPRVIVGTA